MSDLKEKYIQFCCDFYNEHAPEDKDWFGRMFDECAEEHNKRNSAMFRWQFPLMVLQNCQKELEQAYEDIETFATAHTRECEFKAQMAKERDILKNQLRSIVSEFDLWGGASDQVDRQIEIIKGLIK